MTLRLFTLILIIQISSGVLGFELIRNIFGSEKRGCNYFLAETWIGDFANIAFINRLVAGRQVAGFLPSPLLVEKRHV